MSRRVCQEAQPLTLEHLLLKILLEIVNVDKNACYEFLAPIHTFRFRVKKDYTRDKSPFSHAQGSPAPLINVLQKRHLKNFEPY